MPTRRSILSLSLFTALGAAAACSSGDPYDLRPGSAGAGSAGWVDPNGGYDAAPAFNPVWPDASAWDAGAWDAAWGPDATGGSAADSGAIDSGSPSTTQGNVGSCGNPICAGDGVGDCGCYATDSQGNAVTFGCSGTDCACFVNQQQSDDDVEVDGVCDSNGATAQAFLIECSCQ
jgi:hypothetical protein